MDEMPFFSITSTISGIPTLVEMHTRAGMATLPPPFLNSPGPIANARPARRKLRRRSFCKAKHDCTTLDHTRSERL
ncbi:hypothetical protein [Ensifer sp. 1H6]|uniref:hypothetical protein n=1 Tax=Ensifer sp. 1H6 TaxID=1911585 RepID=UPI000FE21DCA|nr:hypothetical protein [Ensifer sp. 1H6]